MNGLQVNLFSEIWTFSISHKYFLSASHKDMTDAIIIIIIIIIIETYKSLSS